MSLDMVRLKLSFINGKGEWLSTHAQTYWSRFGKRRDGLRRTLRSWKPSLPSLTSSTTRDALRSAESSMKSLLDAQEQREQLERQLRSLETASGR